jgi:hypothetical protein
MVGQEVTDFAKITVPLNGVEHQYRVLLSTRHIKFYDAQTVGRLSSPSL